MATTTRRTFVGAAALGAIGATVAVPQFVLGAQDAATPATEGDAAASSLLSGLGLPEFTVTVTNEGLEFEPETTAGTILLKATNQSDGWAGIQFLQVDPSITEEDILAGLGPETGIPAFAHESVMTGGVSCEPGASGEVAFVLGPGDWWVLNTGEAFGLSPLVVSGEVAEVAIEADIEVEMSHHDFTMPSEVPAGAAIWHVVNVDPVLHHLLILSFPRAVTEDEVLAAIMAQEGMGTPPADLDVAQIGFMGESGLISQGQSNWVQYDLPAGNYAGVCFISDPGKDQPPHAMIGMIEVFTVS
jgi:hypothetical protein